MRGSRARWVGLALGGSLLASSVGVAASDLPEGGAGEFADYELVPMLDETRAYAGPATPTSLEGVHIGRIVGEELSPAARARLAEQGFVIVPARMRLFHEAYGDLSWDGTPTFVTTDAAYNAWHLVFDKILRDVEQERLLPALEQLVAGMQENAAAQLLELAGSDLEDDAARVHDLLSVAAAILGLPHGTLSDRAKAEQALIAAHGSVLDSPVLETVTDYSLFRPRGHYTRSKDLERYFVAMSVLGQHAFGLPDEADSGGDASDKTAGLRRAVLASRVLVGDAELESLWRLIFEPTAFLVGVSDDYTPFELAEAVESSVPGGWAEPTLATDPETLQAVSGALRAARPVRIDPERASVRLMGTRFVLDSWILDQLVGPNVGTQSDPRVLGSPLDVAAAFGSDFALAIQDETGQTAKANYPEQMAFLRPAVAARPDEAWGRTVYDAWLAAVEPMWLPRGEAFPDFMRSDAWRTKSQQTGFGSYAELKHDTILYAKQPTGDTGGGPEPPRFRQWVEPDPVPFERLSALASLTRDGLVDRDLLTKEQRRLLGDYIALVDRLARIAAAELSGRKTAKDDNESLTYIGGELKYLWERSGDRQDWDVQADEDAAIIADIMRGIEPGGPDQVLEVGTGFIDRIYVIVPDDDGHFRVARGGVYSYYEFPWPTPDRLTDERWREMLAAGEAPGRPSWQAPLFPVGSDGSPAPAPTPRPSRRDIEDELGDTIAGATWEPYRRSPAGARFDPFKAGARTGVIFDDLERELDDRVDYVVLFRFANADRLDRYWRQRVRAVASAVPERTEPCRDGRAGRGPWAHGQILCYVSDAGIAQVRWTDERTDTYGVMNGVRGLKRLADLVGQWERIVAS